MRAGCHAHVQAYDTHYMLYYVSLLIVERIGVVGAELNASRVEPDDPELEANWNDGMLPINDTMALCS